MAPSTISDSLNHFEVVQMPKIAHSLYFSRKKADESVIHRCANLEDRYVEGQKLSSSYLIGGNHNELFIRSNSTIPYRKTMPCKLFALDIKENGLVKRSSMYRSSLEVRRVQKLRGEKNLEPFVNGEAFLSLELFSSSPLAKSNESVQLKSPSVEKFQAPSTSNMEFLDLSFRDLPEERSKISLSYSDLAPMGSSSASNMVRISSQTEKMDNVLRKVVGEVQVEETKCSRHQFLSTKVDSNICHEKDAVKSSEKREICKFSHAEREMIKSSRASLKSGRKTRFSSFKKMLDPLMKSKSLRNPIHMEPESSSSTPDSRSFGKYKVFPRSSLLNNFAHEAQKIDNGRTSVHAINTVTSPVHLHAILKWEFNHGGPSYEFSVKDPEDVLSAKTWKTETAFNWVYTFHDCKMKSNITGYGKKDGHFQPCLMMGQMHASCCLCSEVGEAGSLDKSAVTEFTLYDIARARRSVDFNQTSASSASDSLVKRPSSEFDFGPSTSYPWGLAQLQPNLELAAIVTQISLTKKELLENARTLENDKHEDRKFIGGHSSPAYVKVVTPSGRHGLPDCEEDGPSSLLDRWRFGGGCDCGGWDMGCPIVVFDNADNDDEASSAGTQQQMALFVKGKKENLPALTIKSAGKGLYAVDFHAQLSTLQAFSICIAMLHSFEVSSSIGHDKSKHRLNPNALKLILKDEVRHFIEAAVEDNKRKETKRDEQPPPSFLFNPPFSPMGRV